jgi:hypothetical protein
MTIRSLLGSPVVLRVAVLLWLVSAGFVVVLFGKIDNIVHGQLYNFGLQFSLDWAVGYWSFARLIYLCLAVPGVFSCVVLVFSFFAKNNGESRVVRRDTRSVNRKTQGMKENNMVISCPHCRKMFGKPLTMLDFASGKGKLVNVCPYCNRILGDVDEKGKAGVFVDLDKQVLENK